MANVSITIPDALVPRVRAAMRVLFPAHEELTDAEAFRRITGDYWREILASYEAQVAGEAALKAAQTKAITDSSGIG